MKNEYRVVAYELPIPMVHGGGYEIERVCGSCLKKQIVLPE